MIFIYNDYGGTHTTSLAAAYHLKKNPDWQSSYKRGDYECRLF